MKRELYIKPCLNTPITSVKVLIDSLYRNSDNNNRRNYARSTFKDPECTMPECCAGRRSFEDLLCLARTYFPKTTEVELMTVLKELEIKFYFCYDIKKMVFHYQGTESVSKSGFEEWAFRDDHIVKGSYTPTQLGEIYQKAYETG